MLEVRYRLVHPPDLPSIYTPWFRRVADGCVHGFRLERLEGGFRARVAAVAPPPRLDAFAEDVLAAPTPNSLAWRLVGKREGIALIESRWREPVMPDGLPSPFELTHRILGDAARCSWSVPSPDQMVLRILLPDESPPLALWETLREGLERYNKTNPVRLRLELERLRPIAQRTREPHLVEIGACAFELGAFDDPPMTDRETLARVLDAPPHDVAAAMAAWDPNWDSPVMN